MQVISESWTQKKRDRDKLMAFELKCYRRILHIRWQQMITNEEVRRRMNLFGHKCRMNNSRLIKQVVFGMVDGSGIRGRPNKEWLDDIKEWRQMDVHSISILAQARTEWRQFVKRVVDTNGH